MYDSEMEMKIDLGKLWLHLQLFFKIISMFLLPGLFIFNVVFILAHPQKKRILT